jgi:hypothetical protein
MARRLRKREERYDDGIVVECSPDPSPFATYEEWLVYVRSHTRPREGNADMAAIIREMRGPLPE